MAIIILSFMFYGFVLLLYGHHYTKFLSCETCVLSNCFLLNNKICLKKIKEKIIILNFMCNFFFIIGLSRY